jgi:hypothetical protein
MSSDMVLCLRDIARCHDKSNLIDENQQIISDVVTEKMKAGPKKTRIRFIDSESGKVLEDISNKIVLSGSQFNAMSVFGITTPAVQFQSYNDAMHFTNDNSSATPECSPHVCLFSIADSGCGASHNQIKVSSYTDKLQPAPADPTSISEFNSNMIMPFRFVRESNDLSANLRKFYFGRKLFSNLTISGQRGWVGYYFKKFESDPMLHMRFADGTQITNDNISTIGSTQDTECYVEARLRITRLDFRDYFEKVLGWDKARVSSMSLNYSWYYTNADTYKYFQDITSYSLLNFDYKELQDLTIAMDILYEIYY